jgi:hypothetical protein
MFHRVEQYALMNMGGRWYRPRAYGSPRQDGTWDGWIVFFPVGGGLAIAPPGPETTQSTLAALAVWAAGVTPVYLEGALARALRLAQQPPLLAELTEAEYEALEDAERLEAAAGVERMAADLDDAAAAAARADAEQIRRERLAAEGALAATEEAAATVEADVLEQAAQDARAVAAAAARRRRSAQAQRTPSQMKRSSRKLSRKKK